MGRETTTGRVLEEMVLPALRRCGYTCIEQAPVGCRPGGRQHKVDLLVTRDDATVLVSVKWQEASGTAEQKVPFEVMCLADALKAGTYAKAYLVLGGPGWTLRDWFVSGALKGRMVGVENVDVVTLETFVARANQGRL
jgi:hypothetical protein